MAILPWGTSHHGVVSLTAEWYNFSPNKRSSKRGDHIQDTALASEGIAATSSGLRQIHTLPYILQKISAHAALLSSGDHTCTSIGWFGHASSWETSYPFHIHYALSHPAGNASFIHSLKITFPPTGRLSGLPAICSDPIFSFPICLLTGFVYHYAIDGSSRYVKLVHTIDLETLRGELGREGMPLIILHTAKTPIYIAI